MTPKNVVTWMPENCFFRTPLWNQRIHGSQTLVKSPRRHFCPNFPLIRDKLSYKTSLLVRSKILGLFGNTLTADHMYCRHNWDRFPRQVQTQLSHKLKRLFEFCFAFSKSTWIFTYFETLDQLHGLNIWEVIDSEKCDCLDAKSSFFRTPLRNQRVHGSQDWQNLHGGTFVLIFH